MQKLQHFLLITKAVPGLTHRLLDFAHELTLRLADERLCELRALVCQRTLCLNKILVSEGQFLYSSENNVVSLLIRYIPCLKDPGALPK